MSSRHKLYSIDEIEIGKLRLIEDSGPLRVVRWKNIDYFQKSVDQKQFDIYTRIQALNPVMKRNKK